MSFLSNLFGGNSAPQVNYKPVGITNQTGFSVSPGGDVTQSPGLSANIGNLQSTFQGQGNALGGLAATVAPGFSQFRQAGLTDIANQYMAQRSNLQDTLSQRRVLGSSFANSQFGQLASQQATDTANFEASSYLNELQQSYNLIQAQYTAYTNSYSTAISQSNIEAQTAASLTASNNNTAAQIATANAKLQAQAQAGAGSFLGTILGLGLPGTTPAGGTTGGTLGGNLISSLGSGASSGIGSLFSGAGSTFASLAPLVGAI